MKSVIVAVLANTLAVCAVIPMAEPAVSPDRKEIAFVSGGDIWTVPAQGGEARLLVSHSATEGRPLFSPDGKRLAFLSTRDGAPNIYILELATGEIRRLTHSDTPELLDAWSRDGAWIYFSSAAADIGSMNDIWRIRAEGGTPMPVSADRYASEFHGQPSPDGKRLLFAARGFGALQWWRKGHSHLDESEIWLLDESATVKDKQLLDRGAKQLWPQWMPDGQSFYFVSDRKGAQNIHSFTTGKTEKQVTSFTGGRVLYPNLSYDGKLLVFERDFAIWKLDLPTGKPEKLAITLRGSPASPAGINRLNLTTGFSGLALSPDNKKVVFSARGEIWAAAAVDGGDAFRVTRSPDPDGQPKWSSDSNQIAYVSTRDGARQLMLYDFVKKEEKVLTSGSRMHFGPAFSPDGKKLAYYADGEELRVRTLSDGAEKVVFTGRLDRDGVGRTYSWSPDSRWIAALVYGPKNFRNVQLVKADGSESHPVSWLPNSFSSNVSWMPDGSALFFETGQRTENGQIARIDLKPRPPVFREEKFRELFQTTPDNPADKQKPSGKAEPSNKTEITPAGLRDRVSLLPLGIDAGDPLPSPDGKTLLFLGEVAGKPNLYTYSLDPLAREAPVARQLTSTDGFKSSPQWSKDGKSVYYTENGRVMTVNLDNRQPKAVAISAELEVNFAETRRAVFEQAWMTMRDLFYDPAYHGADWKGEVHKMYGEVIEGVRTPDEMLRVLNLMVGELNASHLGVSNPSGAPRPGVGRLGVDWDPAAYETQGKLKIAAIFPNGPLYLAGGGVAVGDILVSIDGVPVKAGDDLNALLQGRVGKEVELILEPRKTVRVRPISTGEEKNLRYKLWVQERRDLVSKWSNNKLGYVHMPDMGSGSLNQLYLDLDADAHTKDGVVVDIRNNNGGFVNAYALDVLARRNYLGMQPRGLGVSPARTALGQRALEKPTVLLVNQHSLSDAEDFTEGYRALGLGKIVGEPTAGWIIYTSAAALLDGSMIRTPFIKITSATGEDMELHPRPVDIPVTRPMGESYRGSDTQLETAVKTLQQQIASGK